MKEKVLFRNRMYVRQHDAPRAARVAEHPAADETVRWRARTLLGAVDLAAERLDDPQKRQAYDQLLDRGGAPKVSDLVAEIEPSADVDFAPTADTPEAMQLGGGASGGVDADAPAAGGNGGSTAPPEKKGMFARLFGGG